MKKQALAVLLYFASASSWADRFASSDYECDQVNKSPDAGFRCMVFRRDSPANLLIWSPPEPSASDEHHRKRQYEIQQVMDAFVSRGGKFIEVRGRSHAGALMVVQCSPSRQGGSALCDPPEPLQVKPGDDLPEWAALMK